MRPLKLTMSAFGTFANKTEIDLSKLGENGIYLITGDTGAGKTTIFDAICFALYGSPSGKNRTEQMIRSDYAKPDSKTYVELEFLLDGKKYKIKRNPEYQRPKTRGEGMTDEKKHAELTLPDGRIISGYSEVNKQIIEITGLDKEQFSRVAMIAQGDFQKLLFSETKERGILFRKIFGTENFDRLQNALKDLSSSARDEYNKIKLSINQYFGGVSCDENSEKYLEYKKIAEQEIIDIEKACTLIDELVKADSKAVSLLETKNASEQKIHDDLNKRYGKAQEQLKDEQRAKELITLIENEIKLIEEAEKEYNIADEKLKDVPKLNEQLAKIKATFPEYDELSQLNNTISQIDKQVITAEQSIQKLDNQLNSYNAKLQDMQKKVATEPTIVKNLAEKENETQKLQEKAVDIEQLSTWNNEYQNIKLKHKSAKKDYQIKRDEYQEKQSIFEKANIAFLDAQAGFIAKQLVENEPCPVCGSCDHPNPAKICDTIPDKSQLDKMRADCEKLNNELTDASIKVNNIEQNLKNVAENILSLAKKVFGEFENSELPEYIKNANKEIETNIKQNNEKIRSLKLQIKEINGCKEEIPAIENSVKEISETIKTQNGNIVSLKTQKTEKIARRDTLLEKLTFESKTDAENKTNELEKSIKELTENREKSLEKFNGLKQDLSEKKGEYERVKDVHAVDNIETLKLNITQSNERMTQLKKERDVILNRLEINKNSYKSIKDCGEIAVEISEKVATLDLLSRVTSGNVSGKQKISLETYIQTVYFDNILNKANTRLSRMSNGHYELIRASEPDKLTSQTGLEINVKDHHTGSVRKVKSLSGGESFLASLSLALGLSDEIQSHGKIQLECMFIDEGFGTLDESTLALAMNAFSGLSEGRLVGIISHVSELKDRIDKQILVKKESDGSVVKMLCS